MSTWAIRVLILVFCAIVGSGTPASADECGWTCERGQDTAKCEPGPANPLGGGTCKETANCEISGFRKVGEGEWVPIYTCSYDCDMTWWVWV